MKERTEIQEGGRLTVCKISECVLCVTVFMRISGYRCVCVCVVCMHGCVYSMGDTGGRRKEMNEQFGGCREGRGR